MSLLGRTGPGAGSDRQRVDGNQPVAGERNTAVVHQARSLESRLGNILALGLMCALGCGLLAWYYTAALRRPVRAARSAEALTANQAQTEMPLPPLGPIPLEGPPILGDRRDGPPSAGESPPTVRQDHSAARVESQSPQPLSPQPSQPAPLPLLPQALAALPAEAEPASAVPYLLMGMPSNGWAASVPPPSAATSALSSHRRAFDRRLSGPVFAAESQPVGSSDAQSTTAGSPAVAGPRNAVSAAAVPTQSGASSSEGLAQLLTPSPTPSVSARVLPTRDLLLPKGAFIDCTLETAIDSTLPGMTTCITATDTFGADGKVVLLERGSKLIGETRGEVQQGSARVFVLWTEARTPTGVVIPLASPGTDALGRSGLPGEVNRHFWQRFGAAILVSIIDAGAESAVQSGNGTVIYDPTATQDVTSEVLKETLHIPPTVVKSQGDRIQVLVARDLDFRSVYELRTSTQR